MVLNGTNNLENAGESKTTNATKKSVLPATLRSLVERIFLKWCEKK